jgi:F-type H+-transporting ATPase subunit gamma
VANLKDIRRRIASVKNTQQITKAMKMVAASKLRRAQMAIAGARGYSSKLSEMGDSLLADLIKPRGAAGSIESQMLNLHPFYRAMKNAEEGTKPRIALVVVSSDRGLCGAYNTNILKLGLSRRNELLATADVQLIVVGRKAKEFFARRKIESVTYDDFWAGRFDLKKAQKLTQSLVEQFIAGEIDAVEICYTEFRSVLSQKATYKRLLPVQADVSALEGIVTEKQVPETDAKTAAYIDGTKRDLLSKILPEQVRISCYSVLAECLASEFGSRMSAMDAASRNAGEVIQKLTLQANRVRQAAITTELMEIIGGAEALKG